jgi:hypothetical protein
MILSTLLLGAALTVPSPAEGPLDWLVGRWACRGSFVASGPATYSISWERDGARGLRGAATRRHYGGGEDEAGDDYRIAGRGNALRLTYRPLGRTPERYRLVRSGAREAVFEGTGRATLRSLTYRREGESLLEMRLEPSGRRRTWRYQLAGDRDAPAAPCFSRH